LLCGKSHTPEREGECGTTAEQRNVETGLGRTLASAVSSAGQA
jgi:hypothetical protein